MDWSYVFANDRLTRPARLCRPHPAPEGDERVSRARSDARLDELVRAFARQRVKDSTLDDLDDCQQRRRGAQRQGDAAAGAAGQSSAKPSGRQAETTAAPVSRPEPRKEPRKEPRQSRLKAPPREPTPAERVLANLAWQAQQRARGRERTRRPAAASIRLIQMADALLRADGGNAHDRWRFGQGVQRSADCGRLFPPPPHRRSCGRPGGSAGGAAATQSYARRADAPR